MVGIATWELRKGTEPNAGWPANASFLVQEPRDKNIWDPSGEVNTQETYTQNKEENHPDHPGGLAMIPRESYDP